ncbi:MAG: ferredoxin reductase family protein [Chloroflexota bacterium]
MTALPRPLEHRVLAPRRWRLLPSDVVMLLSVIGVLLVGMWVRHGGLDQLHTVAGWLTAIGQVTALLGTWVALVGILLMSRSPWIDRSVGPDRLAHWHRWTGFACFWLITAHVVATTAGWAVTDGVSVVDEFLDLQGTWDVLASTVGFGLFVLVAVTSIRYARRRLARETWYGLHLYAYLAVALGFAHQLSVGTDFLDDPVAIAFWVALYGVILGSVLVFRVGAPLWLNLRHRPVLAAVVPEGPGVASLVITGSGLEHLRLRAGQYFHIRLLSGGGWWRPHPFSVSAAPDGRSIRFTIKALGDDTQRLLTAEPGTRVFLEGPYGTFTTEPLRDDEGVALIAGGIGISPLRAMLEELPPGPGRTVLIVRASRWEDVVLRHELDAIAAARGSVIRYVVGKRVYPELSGDPLGPRALAAMVPDLPYRRVYVCGPDGFMDHTIASLRAIGVPRSRIHAERFSN